MSLGPRYDEAFVFASRLHASQVRKGTGIPYLTHLMSVSAIALENGATEDEAIAALLHDAVEDQGGPATAAVIRERFGDAVTDIVLGCTDADETPKPPWRARKERYVAHLAHASASVRLVSCSDKLHNARSVLSDLRAVGDAVYDRFTGGKAGTLWYYRALVTAFRDAGGGPLVEELARTVAEMERLSGA
jgi:GTP pyrophosphokinase